MVEVRARVRAELRARLLASGAQDFADEQLFDDVDALFHAAAANDDRGALLLPHLIQDDWQPELALRLASHRGGLTARLLVGIKQRLLLPVMRWLFEYTLDNFRRQHRLNLVLMACLQTFAIEHARLAREVAELRADGRRRMGEPGDERRRGYEDEREHQDERKHEHERL